MPGSKTELTLEQVNAIVLPHGGERSARNSISAYKRRAPYFWQGMRGRACCVHVFSGERADTRGHRCGKIAAVTESVSGVDYDFCAFHSTPQEKSRAARQKAKDDAASARIRAQSEARMLGLRAPAFQAALQKIADGDNDPRRVARIALGLEVENDA